MGARRIFFPKKLMTFLFLFLVVTLKTQVFTVTICTKHFTLQNTFPEGPLKTFNFFSKGAPVFIEGGAMCPGTMAQWRVQAW